MNETLNNLTKLLRVDTPLLCVSLDGLEKLGFNKTIISNTEISLNKGNKDKFYLSLTIDISDEKELKLKKLETIYNNNTCSIEDNAMFAYMLVMLIQEGVIYYKQCDLKQKN